jgi:5-methylcytosine-specific restriction protein A
MQFCNEPGCGVLVPRGRCAQHALVVQAVEAQTRRWCKLVRWQRLREAVLRDDPFCRICRTHGRHTLTTEIDHILKHEGDPRRFWDRANLQGLCHTCHTAKTRRGE